MQIKEVAIKRLRAFLLEVSRLKESEFPYRHAEDALDRLQQAFVNILNQIEQFDVQSDPAVVNQACAIALRQIVIYLPRLGFVLRSTNVRNSFEVYKPLLRLAGDILEPGIPQNERKTKLLVSSEWDYSPFIISELPLLPNFVLIGLPAHESSNPLLLPVAGHELGHRAWATQLLVQKFKPLLIAAVVQSIALRMPECQQIFNLPNVAPEQLTRNVLSYSIIDTAVRLALQQAEESFCDFMGVRVFGAGYLRAFAYLVAPSLAGARPPHYPNMRTRARNLVLAANTYHVTVPEGYETLFEDLPNQSMQPDFLFFSSIADASLQALVPALVSEADDHLRIANYPVPMDHAANSISDKRFKMVVPAENASCLADILNAGWIAYEDADLWKNIPRIWQSKDDVLKELILKSIEVFEIEQLQREATP